MDVLRISRRSWHYRLHNLAYSVFDLEHCGPDKVARGFRSNHEPKSLCSYFWTTLVLTLLAPFWLLILAAIVVAFYLLAWPIFTLHDRRVENRIARGEAPKQSVVAAFVRAKKQRVCPRIIVQ